MVEMMWNFEHRVMRIVQEADENEKNEKNESESQVTNDQDGAAAEANSAGATATASAAGASLQEACDVGDVSCHDVFSSLNPSIS